MTDRKPRLLPMQVGLDGEHYCTVWNKDATDNVWLQYDPSKGVVELHDANILVLDMRQAEELHRRLGQILRHFQQNGPRD